VADPRPPHRARAAEGNLAPSIAGETQRPPNPAWRPSAFAFRRIRCRRQEPGHGRHHQSGGRGRFDQGQTHGEADHHGCDISGIVWPLLAQPFKHLADQGGQGRAVFVFHGSAFGGKGGMALGMQVEFGAERKQGTVPHQVIDPAHNSLFDLLGAGLRGGELREEGVDLFDLLTHIEAIQLKQKIFLALEIGIDRALGIARFCGDLIDRGALIAPARKDQARGMQKTLPCVGLTFLARKPLSCHCLTYRMLFRYQLVSRLHSVFIAQIPHADNALHKEAEIMARKRKGEGQTVLITGASGGIGLELARLFAKDGYGLVLVARSADALGTIAAQLAKEFAVPAQAIAADLSQAGAGAEVVNTLAARGLAIDVLVNNAGYGMKGVFASLDLNAQLGMIDLNMRALVELTGLLFPKLVAAGRGGILNIASTAAFQPGPFMAVYCASKAFVLSFSEALWEEARGTGVSVTCICPGATATGFAGRANAASSPLFKGSAVSTPQSVAEIAYRAFRAKRRLKIVGLANALMAFGARLTPRWVVLKMARSLVGPSA